MTNIFLIDLPGFIYSVFIEPVPKPPEKIEKARET
jgi:hypothetical protein